MKVIFRTALILLLALGLFAPAHAQDSENESVARMVMITPKDGHEKALIKAITDYHHWIANFDGHMEYNWYSVLTGPNTGKYVARTGGHSWADFDKEYDWQKKAGEVFETNVAPHIENAEVAMTTEMTEFAHWPESWEGYTHFHVQEWYVKNGRYGEFRQGLKKIVDPLKAGGFPNHFGFHSVASGGYAGQITLVSANKGWADYSDSEPSFYDIMSKELGSEEAFTQFMKDWGDTFKQGRQSTVKRMPEASDYGN